MRIHNTLHDPHHDGAAAAPLHKRGAVWSRDAMGGSFDNPPVIARGAVALHAGTLIEVVPKRTEVR